jgi:hypothetical protein
LCIIEPHTLQCRAVTCTETKLCHCIHFSYKHSAQTPRKTPSLLFTEPLLRNGLHNPVVSLQEMARKGLDCAKKTSCESWSDSETVINPLLGYE